MRRSTRGFTLIEVLITVVIVGILSAIALPQYNAYMVRARLAEAYTALGGVQIDAEQYWNNNRTYDKFDRVPPTTANFSYALSGATTSAYTVTAVGSGSVADFTFTINQSGARATPKVPATGGWVTSTTCWVDRKGGVCTQ